MSGESRQKTAVKPGKKAEQSAQEENTQDGEREREGNRKITTYQ